MIEKSAMYLMKSSRSVRMAAIFLSMTLISFGISFCLGLLLLPSYSIAFYAGSTCGLLNGIAIMLGVEHELRK